MVVFNVARELKVRAIPVHTAFVAVTNRLAVDEHGGPLERHGRVSESTAWLLLVRLALEATFHVANLVL